MARIMHQKEQQQIPQTPMMSRDSILIALFGALWGLMEITLGMVIKGLRIPMGGAFLTAVSSIIFLNGRYFIRRRGSILMMGAIAAIIKVFSVGTVIAGPFMAIIIEALIAEILISTIGVNRFGFIITPIILSLYTIIHPFISQGIIFGDNIYKIYLETFVKIADFLNVETHSILWVIGGYAGLHIVLGLSSGLFAFSLARRVEKDMRNYSGRIRS